MEWVSGRCLWGDVRIPAIGQPYRVGICHCLDCRKHHDALFFAAAIFPTEAVTIDGATHEYRGQHFCPRCGSSVFARYADDVDCCCEVTREGHKFPMRRSEEQTSELKSLMRISFAVFCLKQK